jgi:hypothetical protein
MRAFLVCRLIMPPVTARHARMALMAGIGVRIRFALRAAPILCLKAAKMSERLETLKKARERMTVDRDGHAKVLAAPFDRDKAERARNKFIEIQVLIDALDRAINGEEGIAPTA